MVGNSGIKDILLKAALSISLCTGAYANPVNYSELPPWWKLPERTETRESNRRNNFTEIYDEDSRTVTMWNMKNVGIERSQDREFTNTLSELIGGSDIFVGQEVRSREAAEELCDIIEETHECEYTSEAGKYPQYHAEVYLFAVRKDVGLEVAKMIDYNKIPSWREKISRPPGILRLYDDGEEIEILTVHTRPREAYEEMKYVETIMRGRKRPMLLIGDVNICNPHEELDGLSVYVGLEIHDTMASDNECSYDAAAGNTGLQGMYNRIIGKVLDIGGSDHYPIQVILAKNRGLAE